MKQIDSACHSEVASSIRTTTTEHSSHESEHTPAPCSNHKRKTEHALDNDNEEPYGIPTYNNEITQNSIECKDTPRFFSIFGPFPKKRTLIQSQAEILRSGPSATLDRSRNTLFPEIGREITTEDSTSPGSLFDPPPTSSNATLSVESSLTNLRASTPDARQNSKRLSFWSQKSCQKERIVNGLHIFEREVGVEYEERFGELQEQLERALIKLLQNKRHEFRPLSLQILVLGYDEDTAEPWIVVNCPKNVMRKVDKFLQEDVIKRMCHGPPSCRVRFRAAVGGPLIPSESDSIDEVFIESDDGSGEGAGARQIRVMQSDIPHYATLGGFVRVINAQGRSTCYGMTAGHVLPNDTFYSQNNDSQCDDSGDDDDEEDSCSERSFIDELGYDLSSPSTGLSPQHTPSPTGHDAEDSEHVQADRSWELLGAMSKVSYSCRARDRDWALVELNLPSNQQAVTYSSSSSTSEPARPSLNQAAQVGNRSKLSCKISAIPARALLPSGRKFVDVNVVHLNDGHVVQQGSSGSWIINRERADSTKVFGTLVATDVSGALWMVPMNDTLKDIEDELGAKEVQLADRMTAFSMTRDDATEDATKPRDFSETREQIKKFPLDETQSSTSSKASEEADPTQTFRQTGLAEQATSVVLDTTTYQEAKPHSQKYEGSSSGQTTHYKSPIVDYGLARHQGDHKYEDTRFGKVAPDLVWFCGDCRDGPYGAWQPSCQSCGHARGPLYS